MIYYISDLHLGHEKVLKFDNRPFETLDEMHKTIIKNWNKTVNVNDCVYILGDVAWKNDVGYEVVSQLKGRKFLVFGNHDNKVKQELLYLFEWAKDYALIYDNNEQIILSHYPMLCWNNSHHGSVHLYGHVHTGRDYKFVLNNHKAMLAADIKHECYNVGCMLPYMNYTPQPLAVIRAKAPKFEKEYFEIEKNKK